MNAPCMKCKERVVGCQGNCPRYKAYRDKLDIANEKRYKAMKDDAFSIKNYAMKEDHL